MKIDKKTLDTADGEILAYLESLMQKKGMDILPPELLGDMVLDLYSRFNDFVLLTILNELKDEEFEKFDAFIASEHDAQEAYDFMRDNVADLEDHIGKAMAEFEKIYLSA